MWGQNSCGMRVEWKLLYTLIAPLPPTRFFLGRPMLSATEHWWTLQHNLSFPIIKAQWDCQDNAPHNNKLHKFKRFKQQIWSHCLIAVSLQLAKPETIFLWWSTLSPEETAVASAGFVALERICKCVEMEFMIQNYSALRWNNKWQRLKSGRKNLQSISEMKSWIMRPVSPLDPCTNTAIRTSVTSWMAIWLMVCPQILPLEEAACNNESALFASLPNDDIQIGTLTIMSPRNYTYILQLCNSKYILTDTQFCTD